MLPLEDVTSIASVTIANSQSKSVVGEALRSARGIVDKFLVLDTGLDSETLSAIETTTNEAPNYAQVTVSVPHAWTDFSSARNAALDFGRESGADWIIMLDTDERLVCPNPNKLSLALERATADMLLVRSTDGAYHKEKIFRASAIKRVRYTGPTHEVPLGGTQEELDPAVLTFWELPKNPDQLRAKFSRDVVMLADHVADPIHAADARWWYYLGDSHAGLGEMDKAIACFTRCLELREAAGQPSDEGAWAAFRAAEIYTGSDRHHECLALCARGLAMDAQTSELAWLASVASWRLGRSEQACAWAVMSAAMGRHQGFAPKRYGFTRQDALWENPYDVLRYALPAPEARAAADRDFHVAKMRRLGARSELDADRITVDPGALAEQRTELRRMLRPRALQDSVPGMLIAEVVPDEDMLAQLGLAGYRACNPSVCTHQGELVCAIRMVNYEIKNGSYVTRAPEWRVHTTTMLGTLDFDGVRVSAKKPFRIMLDKDTSPRRPDARVLGYEDMRPFDHDGHLWGLATVLDRPGQECAVALCWIDPAGDVASSQVVHTARPVEKNWMPIVGTPQWIYELSPTTIANTSGVLFTSDPPFAIEHLRGGSQVIPWQGAKEHLCVAHETIHVEGWGCRRIYLHRFVRLSPDLRVTHVSRAFTFEPNHWGIEFCAGLARDPRDSRNLVVSWGVEDAVAKIATVSELALLNKLEWFQA